MQSALTGHFVLSSLHATDATAALHRFLDMGIEPFLVASSVIGVVGAASRAQDLHALPRAVHTDARGACVLRAVGRRARQEKFVHGAGCNFCAHTGYFERVGVYEVLAVTDDDEGARSSRSASLDDLRAQAAARGHAHASATRPSRSSSRHHDHRRSASNRVRPLRAGESDNATLPLHRRRRRRRRRSRTRSSRSASRRVATMLLHRNLEVQRDRERRKKLSEIEITKQKRQAAARS